MKVKMKKYFLVLSICLSFASAKAVNIDTLWTIKADFNIGQIMSAVLSPSCDTVAAGYESGCIKLFNSENGDSLQCYNHGNNLFTISHSTDGKYLASGGYGHAIKI